MLTEFGDRRDVSGYVYRAAGILLLSVLFAGLCLLRYREGAHYRQVTVSFPQADSGQMQGRRVWIVSPFGTTRELRTHVGRPGYYFESDHNVSSPMVAIAVLQPAAPVSPPRVQLSSSQPDWPAEPGELQVDVSAVQPVGLPAGCTIYRPPVPGSLLPGLPRRCFNWSGDAEFIGLVLLQTLFAGLLCRCMLAAALLSGKIGSPAAANRGISPQQLIAGAVRILAIVVLALQARSLCGDLIRSPSSPLVLLCLAALNIAAWLLLKLLQGRRIVGFQWCMQHGVLLVGVLLAVRMLVAGAWPWYQSGDYRLYLYNGRCILAGAWDQMSRSTVFDPLYIERSLCYGTASAFCASIVPFGDVLLHVSVLVLTLWLLRRAVENTVGRSTALLAVVFFLLYPDVFFGAYLCRHENPFLLCLAGAAVLLPGICRWIDRGSFRVGDLLLLSAMAGVLGVLTAFLEIQRRHGIFMFGTAAVCLFSTSAASRVEMVRLSALRRLLLAGSCCLIVLLVSRTGADLVRDFIVQKCGPLRSFGAIDYIASSETDSPRASTSIENMDWLEYYASGMPDDFRRELNLRKIAFDKSDIPLTLQVFAGKNDWLAKVEFAILQSAAVIPDEHTVSSWFAPYRAGKLIMANGFVLLLLGTYLVRLWYWECFSPTAAEWVLAVYSALLITAILVFGNSEMQYDQCMAFPLALSLAGLVAAGQRLHTATPSRPQPDIGAAASRVSRFRVPGWFVSGTIGLLLVMSFWLACSSAMQQFPQLTFVAPLQYQAADARGTMDFSRQSLCLVCGPLRGDAVSPVRGVAVFRRADFSANRLQFVLSLDQRRRAVAAVTDDGNADYRCLVDGKTVARGKLRDLADRCRTVSVPLESKAELLNLELLIEGGEVRMGEGLSYRLAAEFFH